jgi:hypothetical protein
MLYSLLALIAIVLALIIFCLSRAGMWRAIEFYARIHAEANEHMDAERAARKALKIQDAKWDRMAVAEERKERVSA